MNYLYDIRNFYLGVGPAAVPRSTTTAPGQVPLTREVGQPYPNWTGVKWVMLVYTDPIAEEDLEKVRPLRAITKLAFDNRWTPNELVMLDLASIDDKAAPPDVRLRAAGLRVSQRKLDRSGYIDLDSPLVQDGVLQLLHLLESMGVVTDLDARRAAILEAPVLDKERYRGPL